MDPLPSDQRPPPQVQMEGVIRAMEGASLGAGETGRGRSSYAAGNDNTRPPHVTDKQGLYQNKLKFFFFFF